MEKTTPKQVLIAFDGDCLMCSRTIRWIAERDRADRVRFTRLQDVTGRKMSATFGGEALDSMLVQSKDGIVDRSTAVLAVLRALGGIWRFPATIGTLIPRPWRDRLYDFIASHRYQWFGKGDACSVPSDALQRRLVP